MERQYILEEIRRTAQENGGKPLGLDRFSKATGIRESDWRGKLWENFGDAQEEAGFQRNSKQGAYQEDWLIQKLISLIRELQRFPTVAALRMKSRADASFPSSKTFVRLGEVKEQRLSKIRAYCSERAAYEDVLTICDTALETHGGGSVEADETERETFGYVYLMKAGRYHKIGRTNHVGGRERDLAIQLPEKINTVHSIRTDDPVGIEEYWHNRFRTKRKNGEWFELTPSDIAAFKRRKFM